MNFYCSTCDIHFSDSLSAESHKASLKHKKKSGELDAERVRYKKDDEVTVEDVIALLNKKAVELELKPWSELRVQDEQQ